MSDELTIRMGIDGQEFQRGIARASQSLQELGPTTKTTGILFGQFGNIAASFGNIQLATALNAVESLANTTKQLSGELGKSKIAMFGLLSAALYVGNVLSGPAFDFIHRNDPKPEDIEKYRQMLRDAQLQRIGIADAQAGTDAAAISSIKQRIAAVNLLKIAEKDRAELLKVLNSLEAETIENQANNRDRKVSDMLRDINQATLTALDPHLGEVGAEQIAHRKRLDDIEQQVSDEQEKNSLIEQAEWLHKLRMAEIHQKGQDQILAIEKQTGQERKMIAQDRWNATYKMFGDIAEAAKAFGRKGLVVYRAAAHAQNIMDTYAGATAAYKSLAGIPYVGPALGIAAAAAAVAAGVARASIIQSQQPGFAVGGYTGNAPVSQPVGMVHGREFVFSAPSVDRIGVGNLQALHDGRSGDISVGGASVNVAMINTRSDYRRFLETDPGAEKWVIDVVSKNKFKLGIA